MNESITYEVSPELQKKSMRAYFRHIELGRKWIILLGFLLAGGLICTFSRSSPDIYLGITFSAVGFVSLIGWIKAYFIHMRVAADSLALNPNRKVTVTFSEKDITIDRVTTTQQTEWTKISRVVDADEFLIMLSGKLPVGNLPKRFLSRDHIEFIRSHAGIQ